MQVVGADTSNLAGGVHALELRDATLPPTPSQKAALAVELKPKQGFYDQPGPGPCLCASEKATID